MLTVERSAGREVRSWIAVPAIDASGPLDPRLVPLTIFSSRVVGLGVCASTTTGHPAPVTGPVEADRGSSGAALTDVRSIADVSGVAIAVDLGAPSLLSETLNGRDPAFLYGPPPHDGSPPPTRPVPGAAASASPSALPSPGLPAWRAGAYAIAFRFPFDDDTVVRWLRIDLRTGRRRGRLTRGDRYRRTAGRSRSNMWTVSTKRTCFVW